MHPHANVFMQELVLLNLASKGAVTAATLFLCYSKCMKNELFMCASAGREQEKLNGSLFAICTISPYGRNKQVLLC